MSLRSLRPYVDGRIATLPLLCIHVTEACDSRCVGCSYGGAAGPVLSAIDARTLARAADDLDTKVVLVTGGEPLTVPHLAELVCPFRRPGRRIYLATSGTRLAERAPLVLHLFDELFVSLDGPDAATHDAIRGVPTFEALAAGIGAVLSQKDKMPITARCTVQRANIDRIAATARAARAMGIPRISFLPVDTWSSAFGRREPQPDRLAALLPTLEQVEALRQTLPAIEREIGPELLPNIEVLLHHFDAALGKHPYSPKRCNTPMVSAVVEADGTVRPCFFKAPLGNAKDVKLPAVLNGDAAVALRARLHPATDPECLRCVCPKYFPLRDLLRGRIH